MDQRHTQKKPASITAGGQSAERRTEVGGWLHVFDALHAGLHSGALFVCLALELNAKDARFALRLGLQAGDTLKLQLPAVGGMVAPAVNGALVNTERPGQRRYVPSVVGDGF